MDIRLRDMPKEFEQTLLKIQTDLKKKTVTGAIESIVGSYFSNKDYLRQTLTRNSELHAKLARYVEREQQMKEAIEQFMKYTDKYNTQVLAEVKKIHAKFTGKKKGGNK